MTSVADLSQQTKHLTLIQAEKSEELEVYKRFSSQILQLGLTQEEQVVVMKALTVRNLKSDYDISLQFLKSKI